MEKKRWEEPCRERTSTIARNVPKLAIVLFWLILWQILNSVTANPFLLAGPVQVLKVLFGKVGSVVFWKTAGMSLLRISAGFLIGMFLGIIFAAISFWNRIFEIMLAPLMNVVKTVPVVCFAVLILIWWGASFLSVAVCCLIVCPSCYFTTLEGLRAVDKKMMEMAEVFQTPLSVRLLYIYRPALEPFFLGNLRTCLGLSWKSGVAAEIIGLPAFSIGEKIYLAKISLDTAELFAWTTVIVIVSIIYEKAVLKLAEAFFGLEVRYGKNREKNGKEVGLNGQKTAVQISNLCLSFEEKQVLNDFSLEVSVGETVWLTWPSGGGKTSLLRCVAGLAMPQSGTIDWNVKGIAVLFQEDRLCESYSVLTNAAMGGGSSEEAAEILKELLGEDFLRKRCRELSGGEKRRAALARALASPGELLLLDEPFAGLDAQAAEKTWEIIRKYQGKRTLLIASHILPKDGISDSRIL